MTPLIKESAGWLAPDGKFYPCEFFEHYELAEQLALLYYNEDSADRGLEVRGWAHIQDTGEMRLYGGKELTSAQKNTIMDILAIAIDSEYLNTLNEDLNYYSRND